MRSNQYAIKRYLLSTVSSILKEDKQKTSHKKIIINKRDFFIICLSLKHAFKDILMKHQSHSIAEFISSRQDNIKYKIKIENEYEKISISNTKKSLIRVHFYEIYCSIKPSQLYLAALDAIKSVWIALNVFQSLQKLEANQA